MNTLEKAIVRYGAPGQYDQSPYGAACKSMEADSTRYELFLQLSQDEDHPRWQPIGRYNIDTPAEDILHDINAFIPLME